MTSVIDSIPDAQIYAAVTSEAFPHVGWRNSITQNPIIIKGIGLRTIDFRYKGARREFYISQRNFARIFVHDSFRFA